MLFHIFIDLLCVSLSWQKIYEIEHSIQSHLASVASSFSPTIASINSLVLKIQSCRGRSHGRQGRRELIWDELTALGHKPAAMQPAASMIKCTMISFKITSELELQLCYVMRFCELLSVISSNLYQFSPSASQVKPGEAISGYFDHFPVTSRLAYWNKFKSFQPFSAMLIHFQQFPANSNHFQQLKDISLAIFLYKNKFCLPIFSKAFFKTIWEVLGPNDQLKKIHTEKCGKLIGLGICSTCHMTCGTWHVTYDT